MFRFYVFQCAFNICCLLWLSSVKCTSRLLFFPLMFWSHYAGLKMFWRLSNSHLLYKLKSFIWLVCRKRYLDIFCRSFFRQLLTQRQSGWPISSRRCPRYRRGTSMRLPCASSPQGRASWLRMSLWVSHLLSIGHLDRQLNDSTLTTSTLCLPLHR